MFSSSPNYPGSWPASHCCAPQEAADDCYKLCPSHSHATHGLSSDPLTLACAYSNRHLESEQADRSRLSFCLSNECKINNGLKRESIITLFIYLSVKNCWVVLFCFILVERQYRPPSYFWPSRTHKIPLACLGSILIPWSWFFTYTKMSLFQSNLKWVCKALILANPGIRRNIQLA